MLDPISDQPTYLTTRAAARRVNKSVRSLRTWRRDGMHVRFVGRRMEVEEEHFLLWGRQKTFANPATPYRIRRSQKETSVST